MTEQAGSHADTHAKRHEYGCCDGCSLYCCLHPDHKTRWGWGLAGCPECRTDAGAS